MEGGREREREGGRQGKRKGGREGGREKQREGGREISLTTGVFGSIPCSSSSGGEDWKVAPSE